MKCRSLVCFLGPALLGSLALAGEKGETQPVIIREVQPEYPPDLEKTYTIDPVQVELTVDADGVPFSLTAKGALPDNVVRAISQWRYRPAKAGGRNVGFGVGLTVPTRRPLTQQSEKSLRRTWQPATKELSDWLKTGAALDAAGAAQVEQSLDADPEATESRRITLLAYYANAVSKGQASRAPEPLDPGTLRGWCKITRIRHSWEVRWRSSMRRVSRWRIQRDTTRFGDCGSTN